MKFRDMEVGIVFHLRFFGENNGFLKKNFKESTRINFAYCDSVRAGENRAIQNFCRFTRTTIALHCSLSIHAFKCQTAKIYSDTVRKGALSFVKNHPNHFIHRNHLKHQSTKSTWHFQSFHTTPPSLGLCLQINPQYSNQQNFIR